MLTATATKSFEALPHYRQPHETLGDIDGDSVIEVCVNTYPTLYVHILRVIYAR